MVVENCPYSRDPRVRHEVETLTAAGYQVMVICPAERHNLHQSINPVSIYEFPIWPFSKTVLGYLSEYVYAMTAIAVLSVWILLHKGFDIVHVANPPDSVVPILGIYKLIGKKIIYDQHDLAPELYAAKFGQHRLLSRFLLGLERCSYLLADHIIVTNESYKKVALQRGFVRNTKVTVVRNGPDSVATSGDIHSDLRRVSANIIVFAGATNSQDGLDGLCCALHHLRYTLKVEDFYCVILGDGDALESAKTFARELRVDDKMWFAGWVTDPGMYARFIATADICVAPDPFNTYNAQSTFIKIMEYMAAGKPIVTFDLHETRCSADAAALYARPGDFLDFAVQIGKLINNPELRYSIGKLGTSLIQNKLAWQYSVPNLLNVYNCVVGLRSELPALANDLANSPAKFRNDS